ncbi:hypothetical protein IWW48_003990 [Coemansia sp. RSA 1200]|nr:hypothetical protein IWW48_003990 [Coemansia sp. RSA 1200]
MPQSKVDCYFFMTGTCRNGESCGFRHSARARESQDVCQSFAQTGDCPEEDCGKRHAEKSAARTTKPPNEVPCRNEENGGTCTRADCIFKHSKPHDSGVAKGAGGAGRPMMTAFRPPRKETGALNAQSSHQLNAGAKPFFAPHPRPQSRPKVFGDLVWTPGGGSSTPLTGGGAAGTKAQTGQQAWPRPSNSSNGNVPRADKQVWQQPQRIPAASAFALDGGVSKPSSAESDGMDVDSAYTADDTMGSIPPTELAMQPNQPTDQITRGAFAPAQQARVGESAPTATTAKIPTIYDILGIAEDTSDDNQVDHGRRESRMNITPTNYSEHTFASNPIANNTSSFFHAHAAEPASTDRVQQAQTVGMPVKSCSESSNDHYQSSRGNSPASRVCYASEFASYAVGMEENEYEEEIKTATQVQNNSTNVCTGSGNRDKMQDKQDDLTLGPSITIEDVTSKGEDEGKDKASYSSSSPSIEVVQPVEITTPVSEVATEDIKEQISRPKSRSVVGDSGKEQGLPKILSFQEIMERKRRKKAAEAAAAAEAAKSSDDELAGQQNEGPTSVSKRRVSDNDNDNNNIGDDKGMESDASEGKRRKPDTDNEQLQLSTPRAKNYVAMFEKELEDLSFGLSGPLQNSPASDRISRANINDGYEDADLSQLLGS